MKICKLLYKLYVLIIIVNEFIYIYHGLTKLNLNNKLKLVELSISKPVWRNVNWAHASLLLHFLHFGACKFRPFHGFTAWSGAWCHFFTLSSFFDLLCHHFIQLITVCFRRSSEIKTETSKLQHKKYLVNSFRYKRDNENRILLTNQNL